MIIWGTRGLTRKGKVGRFFCPQCDVERDYRTVKVQRFFTLYFIPVIPMDVVYEGVRCEACGSEYKPAVLGYDPRAEREAVQREVHKGLVEILLTFSALSGRRDAATPRSSKRSAPTWRRSAARTSPPTRSPPWPARAGWTCPTPPRGSPAA